MTLKLKVISNKSRVLYRGINDFKMGYQPRTIIVKGKKGDLLQTATVLCWTEELFPSASDCTVHGVNDVKQTEIQQKQ
jgi:hypothetical protein